MKTNMDEFMNEVFNKEELMKDVGMRGNISLLAYDGDGSVEYIRVRGNCCLQEP